MSGYREELGGLQEKASALRRELDETRKLLEEARAVASVHEASCATLRRQLRERARPPVVGVLLFGAVMLLAGMAIARPRRHDDTLTELRAMQERSERALSDCHEAQRACEALRQR